MRYVQVPSCRPPYPAGTTPLGSCGGRSRRCDIPTLLPFTRPFLTAVLCTNRVISRRGQVHMLILEPNQKPKNPKTQSCANQGLPGSFFKPRLTFRSFGYRIFGSTGWPLGVEGGLESRLILFASPFDEYIWPRSGWCGGKRGNGKLPKRLWPLPPLRSFSGDTPGDGRCESDDRAAWSAILKYDSAPFGGEVPRVAAVRVGVMTTVGAGESSSEPELASGM